MNKDLEAGINDLHANICAGLADPKRIMILYHLAEGPQTANDLAAASHTPQPTVSRHLKVLLNVFLGEGLFNRALVSQHSNGLDGLAAAGKDYTPAWAAGKTGLPADTIRRIAHEFAAAGPYALAHPGWRTSNFINSFQTERAIAILNALSGNIFTPGAPLVGDATVAALPALGNPPQPAYPRVTALRLDGVPWKYPLVPLSLGIFQNIRDAILSGQPYQAHGWFVARQNSVLSIPEKQKTLQAISKLDFLVMMDLQMNDTSWYADVVLPEASYLERYDPLNVLDGQLWLRQPVIEPLGESRSAMWIYKQLGQRLGLGNYFQYQDRKTTCASSWRRWAPPWIRSSCMATGRRPRLRPAR
jgi:thiosulfate reductase/polysulfide reductase chain A